MGLLNVMWGEKGEVGLDSKMLEEALISFP